MLSIYSIVGVFLENLFCFMLLYDKKGADVATNGENGSHLRSCTGPASNIEENGSDTIPT